MAVKKQLRQWGLALIATACLLAAVLPMAGIPPLASRLASVLLALVGVGVSVGVPEVRVAAPYALLAAWSLVQVVPLPMGALATLSPKAAEVWRDALSPIGGTVAFAPLSLCPEATWLEVTKWAGLGGAALLGAAAQRRSGLSRSIAVGMIAALVVGLVHVLHGVLGLKRVYGFYAPAHEFSGFQLGPLLNVNNLSGYLLLGVFSGLALVYSSRLRQSVATALVLLSTSTLVIGVMMLASRSAVAALLLGSLAATVAYLARWRASARPISATGAIAATTAVIGVGVGLAFLGFGGEISTGLGEKNFMKLRVVSDAVGMVRDFPFFGVGRGAFSGVYHQYRTVLDDEFWTHPENIVVSFAVEWGVPITLLAMAVAGWVVLSSKPTRSAARMVLLVGVATVMAQNLFDFGLEALGVGALSAYLFGVAASANEAKPSASKWERPLRGAVLALALVGGLMSAGATLAVDARRAAFDATKVQSHKAVEPYLRRFPADPYFALLGGMAAGRDDPAASLRWYNRALELAPGWGVVHLELARTLSRLGARSQALLELRLVVESPSVSSRDACALAANLARNGDELLSIAPPGAPNELSTLRTLWTMLPPDSPQRRLVESRLLAGSPCEAPLIVAAANSVLQELHDISPRCLGPLRATCIDEVAASRNKLRECGDTTSGDVARIGVELAWASGDQKGALDALEALCAATASSVECFQDLALRAASIKDSARVQRATRVVTSSRCRSPSSCADAWVWASQVYGRASDVVGVYVALQKAVDANPTPAGYRAAADAAEAAGMRDRAIVALRRLLALDAADEASRSRLAELESARPASSNIDPSRMFPQRPPSVRRTP